jgi:hypothetical protein
LVPIAIAEPLWPVRPALVPIAIELTANDVAGVLPALTPIAIEPAVSKEFPVTPIKIDPFPVPPLPINKLLTNTSVLDFNDPTVNVPMLGS